MKIEDHLSLENLRKLLLAIPDATNRLMVLVTYNHALRASEVLGLTGASIANRRIYTKRGKGSLPCDQPWISDPDPLLDEVPGLEEMAARLGSNDRLFTMTRFGFHKLMKRSAKIAGLNTRRVHPHTLKHTAAMHYIKGNDIHEVRVFMGHRSLASTGHYLNVTQDEAVGNLVRSRGRSTATAP